MAKTLFLIRHAESEHNRWKRRSYLTFSCLSQRSELRDSELSERGRLAAQELRRKLEDEKHPVLDVELVFCSPLTRAIETCLILFGGRDIPISVTADATELMDSYSDLGTPTSRLAQRFPTLSFAGLASEEWWYEPDLQPPKTDSIHQEPKAHMAQRAAAFLSMLSRRPERSIAVVTHSKLVRQMTGSLLLPANLEIVARTLDGPPPADTTDPR